MEFVAALQESLWLAIIIVSVLGLLVGSFLNVVIYRLPLMMEQGWRQECRLFLHPDEPIPEQTILTLSKPASRCPHCGHEIRWYENIPVLSWIFLRGKCSACKSSISIRYPLVEIITAICSVLVLLKFGVNLQLVFGLGLTWSLIALTGIDFDTQLLPDRITLPLAAAGLLANAMSLYTSPSKAIWGYVIGFLCLYIVYKLFLLLTGKHGMGYGDFKLLAALGAWMGPTILPLIVLLSSFVGAIVGIILMKMNNGESKPFAFGPYIAIAGFIAFLYGDSIMQWYLGMYS